MKPFQEHFLAELELQIFELAAETDIRSARALSLVAPYVHEWVGHILYRSVVLRTRISAALFHNTILHGSKPRTYYRKHVRALFFHSMIETQTIRDILSVCSEIEELLIRDFDYPWDNHLKRAPLRRLCTDDLFLMTMCQQRAAPTWFRSLTRLRVDDEIGHGRLDHAKLVRTCPNLTHFGCNIHSLDYGPPVRVLPVWEKAKDLKVLAFNLRIGGLRQTGSEKRFRVLRNAVWWGRVGMRFRVVIAMENECLEDSVRILEGGKAAWDVVGGIEPGDEVVVVKYVKQEPLVWNLGPIGQLNDGNSLVFH